MACRLFGAKPLFESTLTYCELEHKENITGINSIKWTLEHHVEREHIAFSTGIAWLCILFAVRIPMGIIWDWIRSLSAFPNCSVPYTSDDSFIATETNVILRPHYAICR